MELLGIAGCRDPDGGTAASMLSVCRGFEAAGGSSKTILLPTMSIERCRQCNLRGWGTCIESGECTIADDLQGILEKMMVADAVLFASPVYFSSLSESLRAFLDRVRRIAMHEGTGAKLKGKPAVGLCMAGGSGSGALACCMDLDRAVRGCGFRVVDMIPIRRQNLSFKQDILEATGGWLATCDLSE